MNSGINAVTINNKKFIILLIIGSVLFLNIIPISILSPILILLFGIVLGLLIISTFAPDDFNFLLNFFLIGLVARVLLSLLFYFLSFVIPGHISPGFIFSDDGWCYSEQGWEIYKFAERGVRITRENYLINPNFHVMSGNLTVYDYFASFIYSITGYSPVSLFFINCVAGSIAAIFIYLIARELFSKSVARISSIFAFLWPSFVLWSTQNLKEPVIAMFFCILLWTIFYMHRHPSPGFLLLSIVSIAVLFKVAYPYLVILFAVICFTVLFLFLEHLFKNRFVTILVLYILFIAVGPFFKNQVLPQISKRSAYDIVNYKSVFEFLGYHRSVRAAGRLQFLKNADISSAGKALGFVPLGLLYAIFAPFPWQLGSILQILAAPETVIFYLLIPFTLKGIIFSYKRRINQSLLLLSIISATLIFLALVESNSGTLFRHRFVAFNLLFIFTAVGLSLKKKMVFTSR